MSTVDIIICILLAIGLFFALTGVVGILRLPDVFGRLQSSTCIATLGNIFIIAGGIVFAASHGMETSTYVKLAVILAMILGTNPISNHALTQGAYKHGIRSDRELIMDDYKEDDPE